MREGFTIYPSVLEAAEHMDEKTSMEFVYTIVQYGLNGKEYTGDNRVIKMAMALAKPTIDNNIRKRNSGNKGGRPQTKEDEGESGN